MTVVSELAYKTSGVSTEDSQPHEVQEESSASTAEKGITSASSIVENEDSSATSQPRNLAFSVIDNEIQVLFARGSNQEFEDGVDSDFAQDIRRTVCMYGTRAMEAIHDVVFAEDTSSEVLGEALKSIAEIQDKPTYAYRRWLLERALTRCKSFYARDAANLGLASLDDPYSIPALKKAITIENSAMLKRMLRLTLQQLVETKGA